MKKHQKLNLKKIKIASVNTMYSLKGGFTVQICATDNCNSENTECPSDVTMHTISCDNDCSITIHTVLASKKCNTFPTAACGD